MIEFRAIGYFAAACRASSLAEAASRLRIAPSTLTAAIKSLEEEAGVSLFRRANGGLHPTVEARAFLRKADRLLEAERFLRRSSRSGAGPGRTVTVELRIAFTLGRISAAIVRAVETFGASHPGLFVRIEWHEDGTSAIDGTQPDLVVASDAGPPVDGRHAVTLLEDRWAFACRLPAATRDPPTVAALLAGPIVVPCLPADLAEQAGRYFRDRRIGGVRFAAEHPGDLPHLLQSSPEASVFLPASMLADRLGLAHVRAVALDDAVPPPIVARFSVGNDVAWRFAQHLKRAVDGPDPECPGLPSVTRRQIRYFNLVHRLRRVSAAARGANISQPSLSEQLQKLEQTVGAVLFERRGDGVDPTPEGAAFAPLAALMETGFETLGARFKESAGAARSSVAVGVLPSVNQHGHLANQIADTLVEIRIRWPKLKVTVREAPNAVLQEWVVRGRVGIAVVETALPHMPRLPLGSSEPLAAIVHPGHRLLPPGPVRLADLLRMDLAVPTHRFGLRRLLDAAAERLGSPITPLLEIDALSMATAILSKLPVCTVLPPSAVRREIDGGELAAHPIVEPAIARNLYVIYSGERALSEAERRVVALLRARLSGQAAG